MLRFCGFGLELFVDEVLTRQAGGPAVCAATDNCGRRWLILEADHREMDVSWLCAPASPKVVDLVSSGRATAVDAIRHSKTGWVELVRVVDGHSVPDRRIRCSDLPDDLSEPVLQPL
jgi:hypothetical protein